MKDVTLLQLLFKVDGQSLTNQRTEPHKSLISKNVRDLKIMFEHSQLFLYYLNIFSFFNSWKFMFFSLSAHFQTLKTKQRMLKEDWEFFKQRRFIEEQVHNKNMEP